MAGNQSFLPMDEEKPKKKRKKGDDEAGEHKPNWREVYATVGEIKAFLSDHVYLRYNTVKHRVEARVPPGDPFIEQSELAEFVSDDWQPMSDRLKNTLLTALQSVKPTRKTDLETVLDSGYVQGFHPFLYYLNRLPPWDGQDYILELSATVSVKGDVEEQLFFADVLRRWLVGMVASWLDEDTVNQGVLVFIGEQGIYKTTWFSRLLPPELSDYFRIKVNASRVGKDDLIAMSQYGLVCYEELDVMRSTDVNTMKSVVTMPAIDERRPYGYYTEHMPHVASFCGTGNNVQFLNDATGNRRWLPFEVERIDNPRSHPFNYEGIYSQAYALYQEGFQYWMEEAESERMEAHTRDFRASNLAEELVDTYYRVPAEGEASIVVLVAQALLQFGHLAYGLGEAKVGRAFTNLGFKPRRTATGRGYYVVQRTTDEIESRKRLLAIENDSDG